MLPILFSFRGFALATSGSLHGQTSESSIIRSTTCPTNVENYLFKGKNKSIFNFQWDHLKLNDVENK